ncbi:Mss4-like protein [Panaeolus papilionaceus]|nr:Mss4-like protein [Panaeolus papilionaceus]
MSSDSLTYVKAGCLCKANEFVIPFATASLPQATDLCHCSSCRHITGQLAVHCAEAASAPLAVVEGDATPTTEADLSKLSKYNASQALTRYFCKICGAYMLYETRSDDGKSRWTISTGSLERTEGIVKVGYHAFVKDTKDGGLTKHYRTLNGTEIPRYAQEDPKETLPIDWKDEGLSALQKKYEGTIQAHCHCRKISLHLSRPNQEECKDAAKWWLVPGADDSSYQTGYKPPRFIAGHCFCTSCRLSTGSIFQSWLIIPRANVFDYHSPDPDAPVTLAQSSPTRVKNLTQYSGSPDTYREFCSTCGATVFWWTKSKARAHLPPDESSAEAVVIDVSAGLIDEEQGGALGEDWISWYDQIMYAGEALDKEVAKAVEEGSKLVAGTA